MNKKEKCKSCKYYDKERSTENWGVCFNISQGVIDFMDEKTEICTDYKEFEGDEN